MTKIKSVIEFIKSLVLTVIVISIGVSGTVSYNTYQDLKEYLEVADNAKNSTTMERDYCTLTYIYCEGENAPELKPEGIPDGYEPVETVKSKVTGYNTVESQTDDTPCISASNKNVCGRDDVIAMNGYKFGTKVMIDGKVYTVEDRKNSRYDSSWIDISFDKDIEKAVAFGVQDMEVVILKKV